MQGAAGDSKPQILKPVIAPAQHRKKKKRSIVMRQRSSIAWLASYCVTGLSLAACIGTTNVGGGGDPPPSGPSSLVKSDKIDLLLVVDNSRSMADKQEILARSMADLVQSASNPPCIDANGQMGQTPASPQAACPPGQTRRHKPITDIHVGVISTSLGGHGSDACPAEEQNSCAPNVNTTNDEKAHLLSRVDACDPNAFVPTYQSQGFLAWDLNGVLSPAGTSDPIELAQNMAAMVTGVGQVGCGYESQLESWYRFLADPEPHDSITVQNFEAIPTGIDTALLTQRANFLRPDSMLVILQLSDENDCSVIESGQYFIVNQLRNGNASPFRLPRARAVCATDPTDPCCKSCGMAQDGCPVDPTCTGPDGQIAMLTDEEDPINLRCFDQKRRFGIDFLYPIDRYTQALTQPQISNRAGMLVDNPIFKEFTGDDGQSKRRSPDLVFYANITGVPWQLISRSPTNLAPGFQNSTELNANGTWNSILASGNNPPTSAYMIESIMPRAGVPATNAYNGGERTISSFDELQYSCIFPLETPRDCANSNLVACDCTDPLNDSPICAPNPNDGGNRTLQIGAKSYPSPRTMSVAKNLGDQGILTSICPVQIGNAAAPDYAYRPAVQAIFERIAGHIE